MITVAQDRPAAQAVKALSLYSVPYLAAASNPAFQLDIFADVVKIRRQAVINRVEHPTSHSAHASTRGQITGFSRKSRKRMIERLAMLRNVSNGFFVTLTYPDDVEHSGTKAKRDLRALEKRLARRFPTVGGIWRIEMKPRLSGALIGQLAPHFHILIFGWQQRRELVRMWLSLAWSRIVYETDNPPRRVRTSADVISSRKHAARYASKYAAKEEQLENCDIGLKTVTSFGRRWATFGALDFACALSIPMTAEHVVKLRRLIARLLHARRSKYEKRLARGSPDVGYSALGLGDLSLPGGLFASTILRMICAA